MTQADYLAEFKKITGELVELTSRKNSDYANAQDAFLNFQLVERLTNGDIKAEEGIVVRMSDKFQRIANLMSRPAQVADEKVEDTLKDLATYSIILLLYLRSKAVEPLAF